MAWDPAVLRKYNTTGHFRLMNQVRSELKDKPLVRPKEGQSVGEANLSRSLTRALEGRGGSQRFRRNSTVAESVTAASLPTVSLPSASPLAVPSKASPIDQSHGEPDDQGSSASFRDRLNAIDMC